MGSFFLYLQSTQPVGLERTVTTEAQLTTHTNLLHGLGSPHDYGSIRGHILILTSS